LGSYFSLNTTFSAYLASLISEASLARYSDLRRGFSVVFEEISGVLVPCAVDLEFEEAAELAAADPGALLSFFLSLFFDMSDIYFT